MFKYVFILGKCKVLKAIVLIINKPTWDTGNKFPVSQTLTRFETTVLHVGKPTWDNGTPFALSLQS